MFALRCLLGDVTTVSALWNFNLDITTVLKVVHALPLFHILRNVLLIKELKFDAHLIYCQCSLLDDKG